MIMTMHGFMVDRELKVGMPKGHEASPRCLPTKVFTLGQDDNHLKDSPEIKEGENLHQDGVPGPQKFRGNKPFSLPSQGLNSHPYYPSFGMWSPLHYVEYQDQQPVHWSTCENHFYPVMGNQQISVGNHIQYMPVNTISQAYPCDDAQFENFQYFVVIDFEATCDKERNPFPQEIIEFPSVLVDSATGKVVDHFREYVRPYYHQHLTDFCKELTGIQQSQVDTGIALSEALLMHDRWLEEKGVKHQNFAIVTWSNWDCRVILESECKFKKIRKPPYFNRWINLKVPFQEAFGVRCNLKEAVQRAGLTWEGRAHCGLDDALNTAHLLTHLMSRGSRLCITNKISWQKNPENVFTGSTIPYYYYPSPKQPILPFFQCNPHLKTIEKVQPTYSISEVKSNEGMILMSGPMQVRYFVGSGNWTSARGAARDYFERESP